MCRTPGRSPRRWRWSPPPRCGRRRSACATRAPTARRSATSPRTSATPTRSTAIRSWSTRDTVKRVGHHRHHHRQGPVRRAQHQPAAPGARPVQGVAGARARRSTSARIGNKGFGFMQRLGANIVSHVVQLGDRPQMEKLIGAVKVMLDGYTAGPLRPADDRLHPLHQHHEAGAGDRAAAAALGRAPRRARDGRGTTSTSPRRRWCSTRC